MMEIVVVVIGVDVVVMQWSCRLCNGSGSSDRVQCKSLVIRDLGPSSVECDRHICKSNVKCAYLPDETSR